MYLIVLAVVPCSFVSYMSEWPFLSGQTLSLMRKVDRVVAFKRAKCSLLPVSMSMTFWGYLDSVKTWSFLLLSGFLYISSLSTHEETTSEAVSKIKDNIYL